MILTTDAKKKCKKKPCSNIGTNQSGGSGADHNGTPVTPQQKIIILSVGGGLLLISIIIFCACTKCCGCCKKKPVHTIAA